MEQRDKEEKLAEETKELNLDYKKEVEPVMIATNSREEDGEIAQQIARDRFVNKILIATLVFLSVAVIITLGIGLSIIFLDQGGFN